MNLFAKNLALLFAVICLGCLHAHAQNCGPWANVTGWQVTFTVSTTGSGVDDFEGFSWTIGETGSYSGPFIPGPPCEWTWNAGNESGSGSVNNQGTFTCGNGTTSTYSFVGNGFLSSTPRLTIDTTNNTYTFYPTVEVPDTATSTYCGGPPSTSSGTFGIVPEGSVCTAFAAPTFSLPAKVGTLQQSNYSFTALANCPFGVSTPWTLSFTLTPTTAPSNDNIDDPCKPPAPVGSSIACQNQSLREDKPIVGTGFVLHYESDRSPGVAGADPVAAADVAMIGGWTLNVHHAYDPSANILFLGDGEQRSGWQLATPTMYNGNYLVTAKDGSEVYVFNTNGRHLQTLTPLIGALKYQFGYDPAGNLTSITDADGNITTILRNSSEQATSIVSPYSQSTNLGMDGKGFLSSLVDPDGNTQTFSNSTTGLLQGRADANGNLYTYAYTPAGELTSDSDPAGGSTTLNRTVSGSAYTVNTTTALGMTVSFEVTPGANPGEQLTNTWPNGLQASMSNTQQNGEISASTNLPDETATNINLGPDPRFGLQTAVPTSGTVTKGSLSAILVGSRSATFTAGNPFSLSSQTDTQSINGRQYTSVFTAASLTSVDTSPVKRTSTTVFDSLERVSSRQVGALLPLKFAYDGHGRLSTLTQGTRTTTFSYDSSGFLASKTDPLKLTTSYTHDSDGHLLTETLPDSRVISYAYDKNGNLTSITPPGKVGHDFSFTSVDQISKYTPPAVSGTGATTYGYNADRELTAITLADGSTVKYGYDSAGRLASTTTPTESIAYSFDGNTGNLISASVAGGEAMAFGYNGPLPDSATWTGTIAGSVSRSYDDNFWVNSQSINNSNTINFTHDNDGLLTKAGSLTLKLDPKDGLIKGTTLGSATDIRTYDTYGEMTGLTAKYKTATLYAIKFTYDKDGRITAKTETIGGAKDTFNYSYDKARRLTGVKENGTSISSYTYDSNSNRLTATTSAGKVSGTYDAQDRLLTYGNASYTYTANGDLASQTVGSQSTSYQYDVLGNLIAVTLPNGTKITYIIDPENHRVEKEVNGILQTGFLYDGSRIAAQLNGSNTIVSQFIYASSATTPDYMVSGGVTYRIFSDKLGSPRLLVNTATGSITEQIGYDEFGNVISDSNPGFQPFGFAGGLYDQDTKFVRFGARDYNPAIGRWTAKDLILFAGGDTNLYGYVLNDPINWSDPSGKKEDAVCHDNPSLAIQDFLEFRLGDQEPLEPMDDQEPLEPTPSWEPNWAKIWYAINHFLGGEGGVLFPPANTVSGVRQ
jgi:RHS repeat-associated protein